jgi:hypothetical protein
MPGDSSPGLLHAGPEPTAVAVITAPVEGSTSTWILKTGLKVVSLSKVRPASTLAIARLTRVPPLSPCLRFTKRTKSEILTRSGVSVRFRLQVIVSIGVGALSSVSTVNPRPFLSSFCSGGDRPSTATL